MRRLVAAALLVGVACAPAPGRATDADVGRGTATWRGLDVPYVQVADARDRHGRVRLRFQGTRVDFWEHFPQGIFSVAATADSAIAMKWRYRGEGDDVEGPLLEVGADGTTGRVERGALGIPMADPNGHTAYWTRRERRRVRLVGYDTATRTRVLGPVFTRDSRVLAVDGDRAYVLGAPWDGSASAWSWSPGEVDPTEVPLPPASDPESSRLLVDVSGDRVLTIDWDEGEPLWSDLRGNVLGAAPSLTMGALSPDARYLAEAWEQRVKVVDLQTGEVIVPGLSRRMHSFTYRWAPDGRLVLTATPRDVWSEYDDANAAYRFVCAPPEMRCRRLPGRSALFYEDMIESSSWGQVLTLLIPIGSREGLTPPKALERYLRRN